MLNILSDIQPNQKTAPTKNPKSRVSFASIRCQIDLKRSSDSARPTPTADLHSTRTYRVLSRWRLLEGGTHRTLLNSQMPFQEIQSLLGRPRCLARSMAFAGDKDEFKIFAVLDQFVNNLSRCCWVDVLIKFSDG